MSNCLFFCRYRLLFLFTKSECQWNAILLLEQDQVVSLDVCVMVRQFNKFPRLWLYTLFIFYFFFSLPANTRYYRSMCIFFFVISSQLANGINFLFMDSRNEMNCQLHMFLFRFHFTGVQNRTYEYDGQSIFQIFMGFFFSFYALNFCSVCMISVPSNEFKRQWIWWFSTWKFVKSIQSRLSAFGPIFASIDWNNMLSIVEMAN